MSPSALLLPLPVLYTYHNDQGDISTAWCIEDIGRVGLVQLAIAIDAFSKRMLSALFELLYAGKLLFLVSFEALIFIESGSQSWFMQGHSCLSSLLRL